MKRDMDLVRLILLELEALGQFPNGYYSIKVDELNCSDEYSYEVIAGHMQMMHGAGLYATYRTKNHWRLFVGLTWQGHDLLDSIRDPEIWSMTKDGAEKAGGFTIELLADLAKGFIKKKIKDHTDVDL